MRERRPQDWVTDLAGRHTLERRMAIALGAHTDCVLLKRATSSLGELDYAIVGPGDRLGQVELKAKHQPYRGWGHLRPDLAEVDLFILDELALRKIVDAGRYAYLVVADLPGRRWCVWSTADLVLATKTRTVRALATGSNRKKAKVLLDLREAAAHVADEHAATDAVARMLGSCDAHWQAIEPWPHGPAVQDPFQRRMS
jgi:hypothetical protein